MTVVRNILVSVPSKKKKLPLSVTHPELAKEADGWDPSQITAGSNKVLGWVCPIGHRYEISINTRTHQNPRCSICSNRKVLFGFNDLQTTHPELAREAHEWDPRTVSFGSGKNLKWKCRYGHIFEATPNTRSNQKSGCTICSNREVLQGFNDLTTTHPELAREADGWNPAEYSAGMANRKDWICGFGHKWAAVIYSRAGNNRGCPVCSGQKVLIGFNDLETTHPEVAEEAYGWDPSSVTAGSQKIKNWICVERHIYPAMISNRSKNNRTGCPFCSNRKVLVGFNDLETTHPDLSKEVDGWSPQEYTAGYGKIKKWRCSQGHSWKTTIILRASGGTGCPTCTKYGFDPNSEGWLYFLTHQNWEMYQIGITNFPDDRLNRHRRKGWELVELRGPMDGNLTQQWETAILRMLKAKGADLSNSNIAGKFDGYSEAWSKSTFGVSSIKELMQLTEQYEEE
jgi:hypothetical protein